MRTYWFNKNTNFTCKTINPRIYACHLPLEIPVCLSVIVSLPGQDTSPVLPTGGGQTAEWHQCTVALLLSVSEVFWCPQDQKNCHTSTDHLPINLITEITFTYFMRTQ